MADLLQLPEGAIGVITAINGGARILSEDNKLITVKAGTPIHLNDEIQTAKDSKLAFALSDETIMTMESSARLIVDDFLWDEDNDTGTINVEVAQGSFSFQSGKVAGTSDDAMMITTPVMTIGVRGTKVVAKASNEGQESKVVLLKEADGTTGAVNIATQVSSVLLDQPNQSTIITSAFIPPASPKILTPAEIFKDFGSSIVTLNRESSKIQTKRKTTDEDRPEDEDKEELEELEEEVEELEEEQEELEEEVEELEELEEELEEEEEVLEEEEALLEEEAEELVEEAEELVEEVEALEEKEEALVEEVEALEELEEALVEEVEALEEALEEAVTFQEKQAIEEELKEVEEEQEELQEEIEVVEVKQEEIKEEIKVVEVKQEVVEVKQEEVKEELVQVEVKQEEIKEELKQVEVKQIEVKQEIQIVVDKVQVVQVQKLEVMNITKIETDNVDTAFEQLQEQYMIIDEKIMNNELDWEDAEELFQELDEQAFEIFEKFDIETDNLFIEEEAEPIFTPDIDTAPVEEVFEYEEEFYDFDGPVIFVGPNQEEIEVSAEDLKEFDDAAMDVWQEYDELYYESMDIQEKVMNNEITWEEADELYDDMDEQYQDLDDKVKDLHEEFDIPYWEPEEWDEAFEEDQKLLDIKDADADDDGTKKEEVDEKIEDDDKDNATEEEFLEMQSDVDGDGTPDYDATDPLYDEDNQEYKVIDDPNYNAEVSEAADETANHIEALENDLMMYSNQMSDTEKELVQQELNIMKAENAAFNKLADLTSQMNNPNLSYDEQQELMKEISEQQGVIESVQYDFYQLDQDWQEYDQQQQYQYEQEQVQNQNSMTTFAEDDEFLQDLDIDDTYIETVYVEDEDTYYYEATDYDVTMFDDLVEALDEDIVDVMVDAFAQELNIDATDMSLDDYQLLIDSNIQPEDVFNDEDLDNFYQTMDQVFADDFDEDYDYDQYDDFEDDYMMEQDQWEDDYDDLDNDDDYDNADDDSQDEVFDDDLDDDYYYDANGNGTDDYYEEEEEEEEEEETWEEYFWNTDDPYEELAWWEDPNFTFVTDEGLAIPTFSYGAWAWSLNENNANGDVFSTIYWNDDDDGMNNITVSTWGDGASWVDVVLNTNTLTIKANQSFNYEELDDPSNQTLWIKLTDDDSNSISDWFYVSINDVNEVPTISSTSAVTLAESVSSGTAVATISAADQDANTTLTYSIASGNGDSKFTINSSTGAITTAASLDYEDDTQYTLGISVTDGTNTATANQVVNVTNVNEAPTLASMSNVSLAENVSSGTSVATASGSDVDASTTLTYSITAGNGDGKFAINSSTGAITTAAALDYETTTSYTLTVQVSDGSLTATTNQVVNITDVNESTTGTINYGTVSTWGATLAEDSMLDNWWAERKALIISNNNTYSQQDNAEDYLQSLGLTVTIVAIESIDDFNADLRGYEQVHELNWSDEANYSDLFSGNVGSYSSATKNVFEDYLQAGGSLYKSGELDGDGYNTQNQNAKDLLEHIDGNMTWSGTTSSSVAINADYRVGPETGTTTYSGLSSAIMSTTDGNLMQSNGASAEWGPEVLASNIHGTMMVLTDFNHLGDQYSDTHPNRYKTYSNWLEDEAEANQGGITFDTEYLPKFETTYGWVATSNNNKNTVEAFEMANNIYIGGGFSHLDLVWDDSADKAYVSVNNDMDGSDSDDAPTKQDDHYLAIGYDKDNDNDLWETTDTFSLDKIKLIDDSVDYVAQDGDASSSYYFKITPVTYSNSTWDFEEANTVTVSATTDYYSTNGYLDLSSNSAFDDINYALIETESALIEEVIITA